MTTNVQAQDAMFSCARVQLVTDMFRSRGAEGDVEWLWRCLYTRPVWDEATVYGAGTSRLQLIVFCL